MASEGEGFQAGDRVPDPDTPVKARRGDLGPVRAEGSAVNHARVSDQGEEGRDDLAPVVVGHVPDHYGPVQARRGQSFTVRAERQPRDLVSVAGEGEKNLA